MGRRQDQEQERQDRGPLTDVIQWPEEGSAGDTWSPGLRSPSASYRESHTCTILRATYRRTAGVLHLFAAYKLGNNHAYDEQLRRVVARANVARCGTRSLPECPSVRNAAHLAYERAGGFARK